ncbi:MAG: class I SAM-dependent methyltransferase [Verrucomicrobia bacterium]|nr:MAG: class I SAM-dependent methyltransferase [Verrucomicrobiota bacterium]
MGARHMKNIQDYAMKFHAKMIRLLLRLTLYLSGKGKDWSFGPAAIARNCDHYGYIDCPAGGGTFIRVPRRNEYGVNYPSCATSVVHSLFDIKETDLVIDLGGGGNPLQRANVVVDLFPQEGEHRHVPLQLGPKQKFVQANIENMRGVFSDKQFDFVFTQQTLEHVDDPAAALREIMRIGKRGFIDVPRALYDIHIGHPHHKWLIDEVGGKLVFKKKPVLNCGSALFSMYPCLSFWYEGGIPRWIEFYYRNLTCVQLLWNDKFDFEVIP